jgi:hypothetical protein
MSIKATATILAILVLQGVHPLTLAGDPVSADHQQDRLMAGEILVEVVDPESMVYRGRGLVQAPWQRVWQGLTEEKLFTRIFHENSGAVLSEQGPGYDVYCFHNRFFLMTFDYCLRRELDRDTRRITWRLTEGDFEEMEGTWELQPVDDGRMTMVSFTSRVKIGSWIPESWVARTTRKRIPRTLTAIRLWGETGRFLPEE